MYKPKYVGQGILDISKTRMYQFHYDYIIKKYGGKAKLVFTDTDSLCYEIETDDFYRDMVDNKEKFDMSEMVRFKDETNKKVIGKFKDETNGNPIKEIIGLRSKMYSIKCHDDKQKAAAKGINKHVRNKELKHELYKRVLVEGGQTRSKMNIIKSTNHHIYTEQINKVGLCAYDDKRYILANGIDTLAYGHYKIA
jgi:hypothetical protein